MTLVRRPYKQFNIMALLRIFQKTRTALNQKTITCRTLGTSMRWNVLRSNLVESSSVATPPYYHERVSPQGRTHRYFSVTNEVTAVTQHLFDKVLIANRGEIAERVIRTCRALGILSVAVYSTADSAAPFVRAADEAICLGPPAAADSYLNMDAVLNAIQVTGAQAVHPGYGFFSENARFCEAVQNMGAVFLGPPVHAIEKLGDKLESKKIAIAAGVDTIPGYDDGPVETLEHALHLCHNLIPYPVLLKAANGGGGKGMRVCYNDTDIREAWTVAKAEALKFFGDDRLLLEKFVERPHHIEFQVMAAPNGNETDVVVFPERECSIQRRNQKVIEESPSVLLHNDTRLRMADQVRRLCKVVGYQSAGTVEFLVDEKQNFFFLEMNTRLQVEHPITEAITGTDLVEAMLYVGAGRGLPDSMQPYAQPGTIVPHKGHAIEARVYAEDPLRGFLPSTGPLTQYVEPTTDTVTLHKNRYPQDPPYVRMDSGVAPGHNVSPYYDPMLCKLVYYGKDRTSAIAGLSRALDEYVIEGVQHNARLVQSVLRQPDFQLGATPTSFLPTHYPDGFRGVVLSDKEKEEFAAAAALIGVERQKVLQQPTLVGGSTTAGVDDDALIVRLGGQFGGAYRVNLTIPTILVEGLDDNGEPTGPGRVVKMDSELLYEPTRLLARLTLDGKPRVIQVLREEVTGEIKMQMYGADTNILLQSPREYELSRMYINEPVEADTADMVLSPMPGLLISYAVKPGDTVVDGQELCIVESMKMQNMVRSPRSGIIASCNAVVGASLKVDEAILTFESA
jgi:propionyl-CoA carboxylase alpha chain